MSRETLAWLNQNVLIGFTDKRKNLVDPIDPSESRFGANGTAWHYRADLQGAESNHYAGAIPVEDVKRRLFHWHAVTAAVEANLITEDGVTHIVDDERQVIIRPDTKTILGVFKSGYRIHQYDEWLVDSVATILDDDLSIGSAGLLRGGAVAWVSVEVPENIVTPEGVEFRPNLLCCTSLDGSLATTYKRIVTNVVCGNTMGAGLGESGQQWKVKHSVNSLTRVAQVRDALNIIHSISDDFASEVAALTRVDVTEQEWSAFVEAHAPTKDVKPGRSLTLAQNKQAALRNLWATDPRVEPWKGTAWGVVQAVNTYEHHIASFRGDDRSHRNQLKAVTGDWDKIDSNTMTTLSRVLATV